MKRFLVHGNICHSPTPDRIETLEQGWLVVEDGVCRGIFPVLPEAWRGLPVEDFGDRLILPGMTDLHVHAPQFSFRGLGMDLELMDWLNTYTFPEEAKYRDLAYADRAYEIFARHLRGSVTTRACIFATIHVPATELLMERLEDTGLITLVGKVNMDRNSPDNLRETSAAASLRETERWILESRDRYARTGLILTPRFIPACSDELMRGLKELQRRYDLPVQSHLSENLGEVRLVEELCPEADFYGDAYDRFGLFGGDHRCIMAHCVHSGPEEIARMKRNGVWIAHSPESNMNLSSGVAPAAEYLRQGLHVGLATDLAAGSHVNMLRAVMHAVQASKLRWRLMDQSVPALTVDQAFYLATMGGGSFFGKVGCFNEGYAFDAVVLDDTNLEHPQPLPLRSRVERAVYLADNRNLTAKYVAGARIF